MSAGATVVARICARPGLLAWLLLLAGTLAAAPVSHDKPPGLVENPGADLWREVRQRPAEMEALRQAGRVGKTTTRSNAVDATVLINQEGEAWRQYRHDRLIPVSMWVLGGILVLVVLLYLLFAARAKPPEDSGRRLLRFDSYERTLHWFMALLFLFLGFTGLVLLWGRPLVIPLFGKEAFSAMASAAKEGHNLMGPVFLFSLLLFLARYGRRNLYRKGDFTWMAKGGGFIGSHQKAGFFNMGEKILFWLVILVGLTISASGLVLLFPSFGQGRQVMELAHLVHTLGAVLLLAVILGHIYMGLAVKGVLEGMKSGWVEYNWAWHHHSEWVEEMERQGKILPLEEARRLSGVPAGRKQS